MRWASSSAGVIPGARAGQHLHRVGHRLIGDGADLAEILRQHHVRRESSQQTGVHGVQRRALMRRPATACEISGCSVTQGRTPLPVTTGTRATTGFRRPPRRRSAYIPWRERSYRRRFPDPSPGPVRVTAVFPIHHCGAVQDSHGVPPYDACRLADGRRPVARLSPGPGPPHERR